MRFLDNKQEVINIKLTPFGKHLLSKGEFNPVYYSFSDEDVVYSLTGEEQNDIQDRILDNSISIEPINRITPVNPNGQTEYIGDENLRLPYNPQYIKDTQKEIIGNSSLNSNYLPAWKTTVLNGRIESTTTGSIPTFEMKDSYFNISVVDNTQFAGNITPNLSSLELENGKMIMIDEDYYLLEINEENVDDKNLNFEIELFEVISSGSDGEQLRRLNFTKKPDKIVNNILLDDEELTNVIEFPRLPSNFSEHYFDVLVDDEITDIKVNQKVKQKINTQKVYPVSDPNAPVKDDC